MVIDAQIARQDRALAAIGATPAPPAQQGRHQRAVGLGLGHVWPPFGAIIRGFARRIKPRPWQRVIFFCETGDGKRRGVRSMSVKRGRCPMQEQKECTMKRMLMAGTAVMLMGLAAPVMAQGMGPQAQMPDFATLDADGSGKVSAAELTAAHEARLAALDADGDGVVTVEEFTAPMAAMDAEAEAKRAEARKARMADRAERMLGDADADEDGKVTLEELSAKMGGREDRMIKRLDADEDGEISAEEFEAAKDRGGRRGDRGDRGRGHGGKRGGDHGKRGGDCDMPPPPPAGDMPPPPPAGDAPDAPAVEG